MYQVHARRAVSQLLPLARVSAERLVRALSLHDYPGPETGDAGGAQRRDEDRSAPLPGVSDRRAEHLGSERRQGEGISIEGCALSRVAAAERGATGFGQLNRRSVR